MPNYVKNIVKMKGITALPLFVSRNGKEHFDFNKIIPMPESLKIESGSMTDENIVYYLTEKCTIPLKCLKTEAAELIKNLVSNKFSENWPQEIFNRAMEKAYGKSGYEKEKMYQSGRTYIENYRKYGHTTWYDWCCAKWGTKWNACSCEILDDDTISFETAWSNPEPIMLKLSEMYPNDIIKHWWADEDMGNNSGHRIYKGGEVMEGDYNDSFSNEAYETYNECWGESPCLYQDKDNNWQRRDCETCHGCD